MNKRAIATFGLIIAGTLSYASFRLIPQWSITESEKSNSYETGHFEPNKSSLPIIQKRDRSITLTLIERIKEKALPDKENTGSLYYEVVVEGGLVESHKKKPFHA